MSPSNASGPWYLDDLKTGDLFRSGEYEMDANQIIDFAQQFDPQPFHTDREAAKASMFGKLAASGWHTAAITMRLLVETLPFYKGLIGLSTDIQWPRPTYPGDRLRVECRVLEIAPSRSRPEQGVVSVETLTLGQEGEPRQRQITKVLAFRKPE